MGEKSEWDWIKENKDVVITLIVLTAIIALDRYLNLNILSIIRPYLPYAFKLNSLLAFGLSFQAYIKKDDREALYYLLTAIFFVLMLIFLEVSGETVF